MGTEQLPDFIRFLLVPDNYPHHPAEVHLLQTHISYVLVAGEVVYKFKKPLDFGFLNFSTLADRQYYCRQELVLNRRLCPDVYLDVVELTRQGDGFCLSGDGPVVEYGVLMRRLPEERMMQRLFATGEVTEGVIDDIVAVLEPFYIKAERRTVIDSYGTAAAVGANVLENLGQIAPFVGGEALSREQFTFLDERVRRFLGQEEIFQRRIAEGRVRDCHGDLHSGNICLADKVYIFDCIEFNKRFRYSDIAADIAFLAMDLDFFGREDLSAYFIHRFAEDTGDTGLSQVLAFYTCYRACVRGKIGLLTAAEPEVEQPVRQEALARAGQYFSLAQRYAKRF